VTVVGAGVVGSAVGLALARRGIDVELVEAQAEPAPGDKSSPERRIPAPHPRGSAGEVTLGVGYRGRRTLPDSRAGVR